MDDTILIRQARPEDIPSLCGLLEDLFSLEKDFEPDLEKQVRGLSMLVTNPSRSSLVLVAVANGGIVGMATVQTLVSTAEGGRVGLVEDVIVDRMHRGSKIGTRLLDRVGRWSRENGLRRLQLLADKDNGPALEFYRGLGWTATNLCCLRKML
jgi:GNAT superfamily N-acetyltransferase